MYFHPLDVSMTVTKVDGIREIPSCIFACKTLNVFSMSVSLSRWVIDRIIRSRVVVVWESKILLSQQGKSVFFLCTVSLLKISTLTDFINVTLNTRPN